MVLPHNYYQPKSDWLCDTNSRVLQSDWLILETNEKATVNINMPYNMRRAC